MAALRPFDQPRRRCRDRHAEHRGDQRGRGGRGAIGTPDDALRVLENYWEKTGGFGCIVMLAHDWTDWSATKRSYELFARYVLPRFEERNAWRSQSMDWMRANREAFSAKRK